MFPGFGPRIAGGSSATGVGAGLGLRCTVDDRGPVGAMIVLSRGTRLDTRLPGSYASADDVSFTGGRCEEPRQNGTRCNAEEEGSMIPSRHRRGIRLQYGGADNADDAQVNDEHEHEHGEDRP